MKGFPAFVIALLSIMAFVGISNAQIFPQSCTSGPGVYAPNATNCQDSDPTGCPVLFPGGSPTARGTNCENPAVYGSAINCAFTCKACCLTAPYSCGDNPLSPINCTANVRFCRDPSWTTVMQTNCPGTCGLCTTGSCSDVLTGCQSMRQLCNDATFQSYMATNCRRTCLLCSTTSVTTTASTATCSDVATNCAANFALCNNPTYLTLMTQKCPRTCGRCTSSSSVISTCTNANANCASWVANGFCTNGFYTVAQRRQYCASSCGLCTSG